jgi:PAS domain S-box-containing protein
MRPNALSRTGLTIFAVAGLLVLALWVAIASSLRASEREILERAETHGANIARSMAEHLGASVRAIDLVLMHLRDDWLASALPFSEQVARHRENLKREHVSQVIVADADGRVVYSSLPGFLGLDVSDRLFFKAHKEFGEQGLNIGAPIVDADSEQLSIRFTRPVYDVKGRFAGVLALLVPPPRLTNVYEEIDLGADSAFTLVRVDGQILARSQGLTKLNGVSLANSPGLRPSDPPAGSIRRTARTDGIERVYRYHKVPNYPLTLYVGQAVDTILAPYREQRTRHIWGGALATVLLLGFALLLAVRNKDKEREGRKNEQLQADLRQSEERFKLIAENIDEVVWSFNIAAGGKLYVSPAYDRIWGRSRETLQENPRLIIDSIHPEDRESVGANYKFAEKGGQFSQEYRIVLPDGSERWIWDRAYPVRDAKGEVLRYVGVAQDITKRKLAEEALEKQIEYLRVIYETSSAAIFDLDAKGVIVHANPCMARMMGCSMQSLIGSEYVSHVAPHEREIAKASLSELLRGEAESRDLTRRYVREDGSQFWGRITTRRIDREGAVEGMVGVIVDITEAKVAIDAVRRNEEHLREVLDNFPLAVARIDAEERMTFANRDYRESYGSDFEGRTVREFVGEKVYAVLAPVIRRTLAGETVEYEHTFADANGEKRTRALRYFPDRDESGRIIGFYGLREDITARRRAEEQLRKLNEELEQHVRERTTELTTEVRERRQAEEAALKLAKRLQNMARRLGEAQEVERRRLAAELHDGVGSHLAAIGLNVALLQRQLPHGDPAVLQRQLSDLIALIDTAKENAKEISVDLRPLLLEERDLFPALEEYARKFGNNTGIDVRVKGANSNGRLPAEKKIALFRIAQEALSNCAKHARASAIAIEFNNHADHLLLSVADDGVGIDLDGMDMAEKERG